MAEEIKVVIGADSSQLSAELKQAENNLKKFQAALAKSTDVNEIKYLERNIGLLNQKIAGLSNTMPKAAAASNQATQSLTNLSRIAQDAPFGFIAIQNNLSPLIESFGRLKAETGTTGGALKSLVQGLAGPAGLGLAFSVGTALITTFATELFSTKKAVEETDKALEGIIKSQGKELTQVSGLIAVLKNENESRERKNKALEELKKINPEIFNGLKLEEGAVVGLNAAYQAYIKNIQTVVAAKVVQEKLEKLYVKLVEANGAALTKTQRNISTALTQGYKNQANDLRNLGDQGANAAQQLEKFGQSQEDLKNNKVKALTTEIAGLEEQLTELSKGIQISGSNTDKTAKKTKKAALTFNEIIQLLRKDILNVDILGEILGTPRLDKIKEKINLVTNVIKQGVEKFGLDLNDSRLLSLDVQLATLTSLITPAKTIPLVKKTGNEIQKQFDKLRPITLPIDIQNTTAIVIKDVVQLGEDVANAVEDIGNNIAQSFGDTLGKALTGEATFGDFFKNIFAIIGQGLQDLGKQFIIAAQLFAQIKKTLALRPELAVLAGIALIAVGGVIKNLSSQNAFAVGTRNAPGGMALVGERGPELVNLPRGSQVIPAAQTSNMMGGVGGSVEVFGILRGQDIYFSNKKYGQTYGRTT